MKHKKIDVISIVFVAIIALVVNALAQSGNGRGEGSQLTA